MKAPGIFFPARPSALQRLLTDQGIKNKKQKKSSHYWKQEDNGGHFLQL